jgi:hypothetical protein
MPKFSQYSDQYQKKCVEEFLVKYQNKSYKSATKYAEEVLKVSHTYFLNWIRKYDINGIYTIRTRTLNKTKRVTSNSIVPIKLPSNEKVLVNNSLSKVITINLTGTPLVTIGDGASVEQIKNLLLAIKETN